MPGLTRQQMEQIIDEGGSVLIGSHLYTKKEFLPPEEALVDDPAKLASIATDLDKQIDALVARRDALQKQAGPTPVQASAPEGVSTVDKPAEPAVAQDPNLSTVDNPPEAEAPFDPGKSSGFGKRGSR